MNSVSMKVLIAVLGSALLWTACKKEQSNTPAEERQQFQDPQKSGVVPDDPALLAKVPLLMSAAYRSTERGKPVKGGGGGTTDTTPVAPPPDPTPPPTDTTVIPPPVVAIPSSYALTMPPVRSQGMEGSCVAFAVAYAARSCEQFYKTNATTYNDAVNTFSPEYVFDLVRSSADCSGSAVVNSLDLLKNNGVCTWQSMPYSAANGCSVVPTPSQTAEAANYKITSYSKIVYTDQTAIKTMIAGKHPVIASFNIDQGFYNAYPGFIWKSFTTGTGSHTMALCGYDDSKHAYKAINSWGTSWGDAGYIWIDYDFFTTVASYYTFVMNL